MTTQTNADNLPSGFNAPPRFLDNGTGARVLQDANRTLMTTTVITTASTSATPFGFATAAQADAVVANLNTISAALIAAGILKTITTPNPTSSL